MSYKALLNAKAVSSMYSSNSYAPTSSAHYPPDEEEEEYVNGEDEALDEDGGQGSQDSSFDHGNITEHHANFNLKRCRFAPRQDIELLKELRDSDDKPYLHSGKASWDSWGKIAHALNTKQIFGPVLTLSALTCKLRFEFLLKNFGGHALKFNPKRGTPEEFHRRDELIHYMQSEVRHIQHNSQPQPVEVTPVVPGKRGRGRPRKNPPPYREPEPVEPEENGFDEPEEEEEETPVVVQPRMSRTSRSMTNPTVHRTPAAAAGLPTKRKPGRPRKIPETPASNFLDGAQLAEYIQTNRPKTRSGKRAKTGYGARQSEVAAEEDAAVEPAQPAAVADGQQQQLPLQAQFVPHYVQPTGLPEGSVITMLAEYLKRHHESDLQYKREEMEVRRREKSEERRLEREQLEVKRTEMELRRAELLLQQQRWDLERQERQMNLELMRKKILK